MQREIPIRQFAQRITIDDRERSSRVKTALERRGNVDVLHACGTHAAPATSKYTTSSKARRSLYLWRSFFE